ncbi:MAG TPA: hypothetical protein PLR99_03965, partial [Polyangiaceae bacterium]|nr:hypothetical protein [Polyangiaceae bacterium]
MRRLWLLGTGLAFLCAVALACSDDAKILAGEGGACELVGDCEEGLACVAQTGQTAGRVCRRLDPTPPGPADATTPDAPSSDARMPPAPASTFRAAPNARTACRNARAPPARRAPGPRRMSRSRDRPTPCPPRPSTSSSWPQA